MNRSEFWTHAFCSKRESGRYPPESCADFADAALALFDSRFRGGGSDRQDSATARSDQTSLEEFVTRALVGFVHDPADTPYQRGFLAAFIQVAEQMIIDDQAPMLDELSNQLTVEPATSIERVMDDILADRTSIRTVIEGYIESIS